MSFFPVGAYYNMHTYNMHSKIIETTSLYLLFLELKSLNFYHRHQANYFLISMTQCNCVADKGSVFSSLVYCYLICKATEAMRLEKKESNVLINRLHHQSNAHLSGLLRRSR